MGAFYDEFPFPIFSDENMEEVTFWEFSVECGFSISVVI